MKNIGMVIMVVAMWVADHVTPLFGSVYPCGVCGRPLPFPPRKKG